MADANGPLGRLADVLLRGGFAAEDLFLADDATVARVVAACRQNGSRPIVVLATLHQAASRLCAGEIEFDPETNTVSVRGTTTVLRNKPGALLAALMRREGLRVSQAALTREIWGTERPPGPLGVYIHDLRRVLERDRRRGAHIVTVRSRGGTCYVFRR